jgi:hypothetical protein
LDNEDSTTEIRLKHAICSNSIVLMKLATDIDKESKHSTKLDDDFINLRTFLRGNERPARKADNLTAICEPIV